MNINTVIIGGNLTADPELKEFNPGSFAAEFTVAINEKWKDKNGNLQDKTHFIRCQSYGKTAENISKYFHKGDRILCEGSLSQETWEDKETQKKREKTKVKVMAFHFVDGAKKSGGESVQPTKKGDDASEDTIPF